MSRGYWKKDDMSDKEPTVLATVDDIVKALMALTEDQRVEVFSNFCRNCGIDDPRCQCWNDE